MGARIQVIVDEHEREAFRQSAAREGLSLSAWLRKAGQEKLARIQRESKIRSARDLREFFTECDERENGSEPDWAEHKAVIEGSIRSGGSET